MTNSDQTDRRPDPADKGIPNVYADPQQPIPGEDATATQDPGDDAAQAEWETGDADAGSEVTATGADPAEIPSPEDQIPAEDLPGGRAQPDTQGTDPVDAELGEQGQGDLTDADL